jgi:hypothetical protein
VQSWDKWGYLACGVLTACPLVLIPLIHPGKADRGKPLSERFWVKANVWQAVFGFIGNYFWTHYFFQLLGASYTMPSHRLNNVRPHDLEICSSFRQNFQTYAHAEPCMQYIARAHTMPCARRSHLQGAWLLAVPCADALHRRQALVLLQVPIVMFLLTHAYFCLYHALSNVLIRRTLNATSSWGVVVQRAAACLLIFFLAYVTAFMETFTISQVCLRCF